MASVKNSLYRYYRPKDFHDFVGQKNVVTILTNQIKDQSFSHALLFTGPRGCGKTSLARIFAKAINCQAQPEPTTDVPCNRCISCNNVQTNRTLNIIELDGASNNGVEEIRNLIENIRLAPVGAKYKVFIIDEVHMLSKGAFNALLKTLEEPPHHVVFILATTEFDKLPTTIVSRCQTFNLHKINQSDMVTRLMAIAKAEKVTLETTAADEIFNLSEGSLRDALNVLQQLIATRKKIIDLNLVQEYFQIPTQEDKLNVLKNLLNHQPQELINYFEIIHQRGLNLDLFILGLLEMIKQILEFRLTNDKTFLQTTALRESALLEAPLDNYFVIGDALTEAFQKNSNLANDYNYVLINLLKALRKLQSQETIIKPMDKPKAHELTMEKFLLNREKLLSQPRKTTLNLWSKEQIFNLLIASSKPNRQQVAEKLDNIFTLDNNCLVNPKIATVFVSWYGGEVVAVSDCEILLRFANEEEVKFFQEEIQNGQWEELITQQFDKNYVVYSIDRKYWEVLKREFMLLKDRDTIAHHHVTWEQTYRPKKSDAEEKEDFNEVATRLFGDLVEFEGENLLSK